LNDNLPAAARQPLDEALNNVIGILRITEGGNAGAKNLVDLVNIGFGGGFDEFLENTTAILVFDDCVTLGEEEIEEFGLRIAAQVFTNSLEDIIRRRIRNEAGEMGKKGGDDDFAFAGLAISDFGLQGPTARAIHCHGEVIGIRDGIV
jgi:hypothetical protein